MNCEASTVCSGQVTAWRVEKKIYLLTPGQGSLVKKDVIPNYLMIEAFYVFSRFTKSVEDKKLLLFR